MIVETKSKNSNPFAKRIDYIDKSNNYIGYLEYSLIYDRIEIDNIFVNEANRNQKIGTKLLEHLINYAKENKIINITLEVRKSNNIARHLYQKVGFKEVAIRKYYYGDEDAILMEKR